MKRLIAIIFLMLSSAAYAEPQAGNYFVVGDVGTYRYSNVTENIYNPNLTRVMLGLGRVIAKQDNIWEEEEVDYSLAFPQNSQDGVLDLQEVRTLAFLFNLNANINQFWFIKVGVGAAVINEEFNEASTTGVQPMLRVSTGMYVNDVTAISIGYTHISGRDNLNEDTKNLFSTRQVNIVTLGINVYF